MTGYLISPQVKSSLVEAVGVNADDELIVRLWTQPDKQYRYESLDGKSASKIAFASSPGQEFNKLCNLRTPVVEPRNVPQPATQPA